MKQLSALIYGTKQYSLKPDYLARETFLTLIMHYVWLFFLTARSAVLF